MRRIWRDLLCLGLAFVGAFAAPSPAEDGIECLLKAEFLFRTAAAAKDRAALSALYADSGTPARIRGKAIWALYAQQRLPLEAKERLRLAKALADPAPEVRQAALRAVGSLGERALEREALKRAAEDPDPSVCVEALRAVRRWSRQGHVFFLDEALRSRWPQVVAEALVNLSRISLYELPPEIPERARLLAGPSFAPRVRVSALEALGAWERLDWSTVRDILVDPETPETLRVAAVALSDRVPEREERDDVLLDILPDAPSLRLAWESYRRLLGCTDHDAELPPVIARFLKHYGQDNTATQAMAGLLKRRGYRVEHRAGAWKVSGP